METGRGPLDWARPGLEPRVEEIVHDPIVQLVMRRDRLSVADIMTTVTRARARLQAVVSTGLAEAGGGRAAGPLIARGAPVRS
jgi:hypothetical protein